MLNNRMRTILRELYTSPSPLTSEEIAAVVNVSSRTVRNDMKEMNDILTQHGASILAKRGTGYKLNVMDEDAFRRFLLQQTAKNGPVDKHLPDTPEERTSYFIKRLLLTDDYVRLEDLADELYISLSTVKNCLRNVKSILNRYHISIESRPNYGIKLKGSELNIRFCMSEYLYNRQDNAAEILEDKISILPKDDMDKIKSIIIDQVNQYSLKLSDISLNNLLVHIAIACKRIRQKSYVSLQSKEISEISKQKEYRVAAGIVREVEKYMNVTFSKNEVAYIAIHLLGSKVLSDINIREQDIGELIDEDIYQLTEKIMKEIEKRMGLEIKKDKELFMGLCLHLKPAINRYRFNMNVRNPILEDIKAKYPIAFEGGVIAGIVIKEEMGIEIDENEIGYIALHLGAAIERQKLNRKPKRCLIVCATGLGSAKLLHYKLKTQFGSKLEVVGTTEYYKLNQKTFDAIDFIISTIPIKNQSIPIPVIQVKTILQNQDIKKLEELIFDKEASLNYVKEELIFLRQSFETKEQVLNFLGKQLLKRNYIDESFMELVLKREDLAPTSFGNLVAIPHPLVPQSKQTFVAICTLDKPIEWGDKKVQLVCLLSLKKNEQKDLQKLYKTLINIMGDINHVIKLLKISSTQEFIQTIKQFME